jgi:hypothetical protein
MVYFISTQNNWSHFLSETITAEHYQEFIMNLISLLEVNEQDCWFQQDGATAHTENSALQMLSDSVVAFLEICVPLDPGSIATGFLSLGVSE